MSQYFVMLNLPGDEGITPLKDENDNVALFETEYIAMETALKNNSVNTHGFEIFEIGNGEDVK